MGVNQRSQIVMSDEEIETYIDRSRTATLATIGADGRPHLVAMWYAVIDGEIWFETKERSQKAVNLKRDPRVTVMIEDGATYDKLRGVSIDATAEVVTDPDKLWDVGVNVWERYNGPYSDDMRELVEVMIKNRIAIRLIPERVRSWDHRKLNMMELPIGGSTAEYMGLNGIDL